MERKINIISSAHKFTTLARRKDEKKNSAISEREAAACPGTISESDISIPLKSAQDPLEIMKWLPVRNAMQSFLTRQRSNPRSRTWANIDAGFTSGGELCSAFSRKLW